MKRFYLGILLIFSLPVWALKSYRANYDLSIRGMHAGEMQFELIITPRTYRIDAVSYPSTLAKMMGYGLIKEFALGEIKNNKLFPQKYNREMTDNPKYQLSYNYQLNDKKINALIDGQSQILQYESAIPLDTLSLVVQSLLDEENQRPESKYTLLNKEKMRTYSVKALPNEKWQDESGKVLDIKVYQQVNGNRKTLIYFASNPLRLVKLQQIKDDESRFVLKLLDFQERQ